MVYWYIFVLFFYFRQILASFVVRFCVTALCSMGKIVCKSADIEHWIDEWVIGVIYLVSPYFAFVVIIVECHGGGGGGLDKRVLFFLPPITPITTQFPFLHLGHILVLVWWGCFLFCESFESCESLSMSSWLLGLVYFLSRANFRAWKMWRHAGARKP